jgi:hypothetical protein
MRSMPRLASLAPWLVALTGLAIPLIAGGGAGWPYVVGWLLVLGLLAIVKPLARVDQRDRIQWALIATFLLVVPGVVVGGIYLVPAALLWLAIEMASRPRSSGIS